MSKIIRAIDRGQATHFNFDDVTAQAAACVSQARVDAARILAEAEEQAVQLREQAFAHAQQAAAVELERLVEERVVQRFDSIRGALTDARDVIERTPCEWQARWEQGVVKLGVAIARRLIRRELSAQPDIPLALEREALQLATGSTQMRLLMNPADVGVLTGQIQKVLDEHSAVTPVRLIADTSISRGGCRVETEHGAIDQQFEAQLARIAEELT